MTGSMLLRVALCAMCMLTATPAALTAVDAFNTVDSCEVQRDCAALESIGGQDWHDDRGDRLVDVALLQVDHHMAPYEVHMAASSQQPAEAPAALLQGSAAAPATATDATAHDAAAIAAATTNASADVTVAAVPQAKAAAAAQHKDHEMQSQLWKLASADMTQNSAVLLSFSSRRSFDGAEEAAETHTEAETAAKEMSRLAAGMANAMRMLTKSRSAVDFSWLICLLVLSLAAVSAICLWMTPVEDEPLLARFPGRMQAMHPKNLSGTASAASLLQVNRPSSYPLPNGDDLGRRSIASRGQAPVLDYKQVARPPPTRPVGVASDPPVLCPSLVLPNTEARFLVSMDALGDKSATAWDITGTSGRKLLQAFVRQDTDGSRCLHISSVGCESEPRATVRQVQWGQPLQLLGRKGEPYGFINPASHGAGGCILTFQDQPVMFVDVRNLPELQMAATAVDGRLLATAGANGSSWRLTVKPASDAVLIASCMLAIILLDPSLLSRSSVVGVSAGLPANGISSNGMSSLRPQQVM